MFRKQFLPLLLALCCILGTAVPALAAEVECDTVYCFTQEDFSGQEDFLGICVTHLPDSDLGTVMLGTRVIRPGDILTADQLAQMTFSPLRSKKKMVVPKAMSSRQTATMESVFFLRFWAFICIRR